MLVTNRMQQRSQNLHLGFLGELLVYVRLRLDKKKLSVRRDRKLVIPHINKQTYFFALLVLPVILGHQNLLQRLRW
jgi:hypothetical protein